MFYLLCDSVTAVPDVSNVTGVPDVINVPNVSDVPSVPGVSSQSLQRAHVVFATSTR
jgi:hypothetical protein